MKLLSLLLAGLSVAVFADDKPDAKKDATILEGAWHVVSGGSAERKVAWMDLKDMVFTFKGNKMALPGSTTTATFGSVGKPVRRPVLKSLLSFEAKQSKETSEFAFRLNETTNPKTIDLEKQEFALAGIFAIEGDQLKICLAAPKTERPKDFSQGADRILFVLSRKKPDTVARDKAIKAAREQFKGAWVVESGQYDTAKLSADDLKGFRLVFDDENLKWDEAGTTETLSVELDPTSTPTALDLTLTAGPKKGATLRAIYELKKDQFTIRIPAFQGNARPGDLTKDFGGDAVLVLKRAKP